VGITELPSLSVAVGHDKGARRPGHAAAVEKNGPRTYIRRNDHSASLIKAEKFPVLREFLMFGNMIVLVATKAGK
jgi:hypothetical protein